MSIQETAVENLEVPVLDGRGAEWEKAAHHILDLGKNFILLLCNNAEELTRLRRLLGYEPSSVEKWEAYSLMKVLSTEDHTRLNDALSLGDCAFFVELIRKPDIQPPKTKLFLVYCEIMGIVAEADSMAEAKEACDHHAALLPKDKRELSLVRIYQWENQQWEAQRVPC